MTFWSCAFRDARRYPAWQPAETSCHLATAGSQLGPRRTPDLHMARHGHGSASAPALCVSPRRQERLGGRAGGRCGPEPDAGHVALSPPGCVSTPGRAGEAKMAASAAGLGGGTGPGPRTGRFPGALPPGVQQTQEAVPAEAEERGGGRRGSSHNCGRELRPGMPAVRGLVPSWRWRAANRRSSTRAERWR